MSTYGFPASSLSTASRGALAYQKVDAQSRSPLELVVMLYDGAIRFLGDARDAHCTQRSPGVAPPACRRRWRSWAS
jgi:hypothetical protein